jgi:hypothetical protein
VTADHQNSGSDLPVWGVLLGAVALIALVIWGMTRWASRTPEFGIATGEPVTVEGCLTAGEASGSFVLTPTELDPLGRAVARSATGVRPTFAYELVGHGNELRSHIGQRIEATGVVEGGVLDEAEVDRETTTAPGASSVDGSEAPEATVRTTQEIDIEQRRMEVRSIQAIGEPCLEGSRSDNATGRPEWQQP